MHCWMLAHTIETSLRGDPASRVMSDNTLKCACRFIDQRLAFGAAVLQTEIDKQARAAAGSATQRGTPSGSALGSLSETEATVSEVMRSVPEHAISFRSLSARLTPFRRHAGEQDHAWHRRRAQIFEHAAALGLGTVETTGRNPMFHKNCRTEDIERILLRLGVP